MERPVSAYQLRRREEERLAAWGRALSIVAAVLFVLITAQRTGFILFVLLPD